MENYYFFKCIRKTIIQFLDMFNDINIERYDVNGVVKGKYRVPIRYGPKSKAYLFVREGGRNEEMLPMISVYLTGIDFDPARLTNKYQEILVNDTKTSGIYAKNAMPYNIGFTVNIWALHMVDIDQIYEQILPYFGPHAFIRVKIPEMDMTYDVKVILNGCSPVMTDDTSEEEARVIKWDTNFTCQTWLFKPQLVETPHIGSIGTNVGGTEGQIITPAWLLGKEYKVGDVVYYLGGFYMCEQDHTASNDKLPGTETGEPYWEQITGQYGYSWTSGMGTTGFGSDDRYGKVVQRYYTDLDGFADRDNPTKEIYDDERPVLTHAFRIVGVDEDAKLILDHESFGDGSK